MPGDTYAGDANGDGYVGSGDLDTVRSHWGESLDFGGIVPEPGVGLLLLLLGLVMTAPRRRR